jgi:deoxyhypusine synthase
MEKRDLLVDRIEHIDVTAYDTTELIKAYSRMSFQARNLASAADIYCRMLADGDCTVIACLAGSLFSAGLKDVVVTLLENNMVDVIVSTGALMVDQDFFEALGYGHYRGTPKADDNMLREKMTDRIYDTYIDEEQLRECDMTISSIADGMRPGCYSSREFIIEMGAYLEKNKPDVKSVVLTARRQGVPVFVPALSDSSAGLGLIHHQSRREKEERVCIDCVKDFLELTGIKTASKETGLLMIGGGVPKNFAQDITIGAKILGRPSGMHKYAVQITVADERDGGLSGSTLKEAHSWGKVDSKFEQMVFCEATIALPLLASYAYHSGSWRDRRQRQLNKLFR